MNANKPVIPREVAETIVEVRRIKGVDNRYIVRMVADLSGDGPKTRILRSIPFDTLLAALVNGYEVEKSAHDRIRDTYALHEAAANVGSTFARDFNFGVRFVLNTLGIKISGVNAPEEDVR